MLLALKRHDYTKGTAGVECGYYDKEARKAVNLGRVENGKTLIVPDEVGKLVLAQNGNVFREVKSAKEAAVGGQQEQEKEQENGLTVEEVGEWPVKKIRELFAELVEKLGEGEVPPVTVKKADLVRAFWELYQKSQGE